MRLAPAAPACPPTPVAKQVDPEPATPRTAPGSRLLVHTRSAAVPLVRQAMLRFVGAGLVALLAVSVAGWYAGREAAEREAVADARQRTITLAHAVLEPALTDGLLRGDPAATARMSAAVHTHVLRDGVLRVKLWSRDGRIVYSDEPALVDRRFVLDDEESEVFTTHRAAAEASDLRRPENAYERGHGPLLEVYLPVHTPSGLPLLFETYQVRSTVAARRQQIWAEFAPVTIGGLVLLLALLVPLAFSLARSLERARAEREELLARALDASSLERRRIAAQLHDGIVQTLVGSSLVLARVTDELERESRPGAASAVRGAGAELRHGVRGLRSLLVEIYPPSLRREGLGPALADLTAELTGRGVQVEVVVGQLPDLPPTVETTVFRVAQEAVRNIAKHAAADCVRVTLLALPGDAPDRVQLTVQDDGRGLAAPVPERGRPGGEGHLGLLLLEDAVAQVGGALEVTSAPGRGVCVTASVPLAPAPPPRRSLRRLRWLGRDRQS